jgi:tetratricopeptide (TPR) repeat protein
VHGQPADALPLFDQALAITQADPAMSDLRLLMQINKGVVLSTLDRHEEAFAALRPALRLADQAGTAMRRAQAHGALGQVLFATGGWDEALAEFEALPADLKEPAVACYELAIGAVVCFHRGEIAAARRQVASAAGYARRIGHLVIPEFALARAMDREASEAPTEALAVLTDAVARGDGLGETEDLIADAVRLAMLTGERDAARSLAGRAAAYADSEVPHRKANALYCQGLLHGEPDRLLEAAALYHDAGRPLMQAKSLEAAAVASEPDNSAPLADALKAYQDLGAAADVNRLKGISRG